MGMRRVADQMDFMEAIPVERSCFATRLADVPNSIFALIDVMLTTNYVASSRGKTPQQIRDEFMAINNCVALLAALLMTVSFDFLIFGFSTWGVSMHETTSAIFIALCFGSGIFFLFSLMMSIFQMIMISQMTSNTSAELFVKYMDQARLFPVRTMCWGVKLLIGFILVLMVGNKHIGVVWEMERRWFGLGAIVASVAMFFWFLKCLSFGVQATYQARFHQVDQFAKDRFPHARERVLQKTHEDECRTLYPTEILKKTDPFLRSASHSALPIKRPPSGSGSAKSKNFDVVTAFAMGGSASAKEGRPPVFNGDQLPGVPLPSGAN
mmetsp:Transcript_27748/g.64560  ORF Transcript_27748/g.64560 Transcript_27748/m.64560 type:complete len:324 (+) Transcript_27748:564-1535(+)